jgi:DNA-directed RNA polymerase specialized sigma subunit
LNQSQLQNKRKSRSSKKNHYFTKVHEEAIVQYVLVNSIEEKTRLYVNFIEPAFDEMVDKIVYTYKFTSIPNIDELKQECKIWLVTILDKFDKDKGHKAFSYFSVITKNWFIHKAKKNSQRSKKEVQYDDIVSEIEDNLTSNGDIYEQARESHEFWNFFYEEVNSWEIKNMKENEERVYKAIKVLFSHAEDIEIFNKKGVYLYLRELTGLNTKQIVNSLQKMRLRYRIFKDRWEKGEV